MVEWTSCGAIALSYPPIIIDDSSWKNMAESFAVALTLTLGGGEGGYKSAIAPILYPEEFFWLGASIYRFQK